MIATRSWAACPVDADLDEARAQRVMREPARLTADNSVPMGSLLLVKVLGHYFDARLIARAARAAGIEPYDYVRLEIVGPDGKHALRVTGESGQVALIMGVVPGSGTRAHLRIIEGEQTD